MKKSFVLIICLVFVTALSLYGFEKGTKSVGGTISFYGYKINNEYSTRHVLSIAPQVSYFVIDNLSVDVHVLIDRAWGGNTYSTTSLGIGLGGRYFYKKFYGGVFFNYSAVRRITTVLVDDMLVYDGYNWNKRKDLTLRAGRLFGIAKNIYLDLGIFYNMGLGKISNSVDSLSSRDNERTEFGMLAGIAIFI